MFKFIPISILSQTVFVYNLKLRFCQYQSLFVSQYVFYYIARYSLGILVSKDLNQTKTTPEAVEEEPGEITNPGSMSHEDDIEQFCIPCNKDGSLCSACGYCNTCKEHLCEDCFQNHRQTTSTMDHRLLDKESMPKCHRFALPKPSDETDFCENHPNKRIKYYCPKHCVICCDSCVKQEHINCKADDIPEMAKNVHHSEELRSVFSEIRALESKCQLNIITARENIKRAKQNHHEVIQEIRDCKQEMVKYLDNLEEEVASEMHKIAQAYEEKLESSKHTCIQIAGKMAELEGELKRLSQTEHLNGLFIEMKKSEKKVQQLTKEAEAAFEKSWQCEHKFECNESIFNALKSENNLGKISERKEKFTADELNTFHHTNHEDNVHRHLLHVRTNDLENETGPTLKYSNDMHVASDGDELQAHITGLTVVSPDKLAVVDNRNGKVKLVDIVENVVVSEVKLDSSPFDTTSLPNHELAVTLPEEMAIQILYGNKLSLVRRFEFDKQCRGICYTRDKLVVTFVAFPGEVRILNLLGEVLQLFDNSFFGKRVFDLPCYVAVDEKATHIYVSDYSKGQIIQLSSDGRIQKIYKCKKRGYPDGIVIINEKHICVCCSSLHYIEMFQMHGHAYKAVDALKQDLHYPAALATNMRNQLFCSFVPKGKKWLERVCMFEIEMPEEK